MGKTRLMSFLFLSRLLDAASRSRSSELKLKLTQRLQSHEDASPQKPFLHQTCEPKKGRAQLQTGIQGFLHIQRPPTKALQQFPDVYRRPDAMNEAFLFIK